MTVYVITHKQFNELYPRDGYQKLLVGAEKNRRNIPADEQESFLFDDTGDNISNQNGSFCELTGLYWIWKNVHSSDNVGIVHYRRYFGKYPATFGGKFREYLAGMTGEQLQIAPIKLLDDLLDSYDAVVTNNQATVSYDTPEMVWQEYANAHYLHDLEVVRDVIISRFPNYEEAFYQVIHGRRYHHYNMMYTTRRNFDQYCEWLFSILFDVKQRININQYDSYQQRVFGFLSERLMDVWLLHNNLRLKELRVLKAESTEDLDVRIRIKRRFSRK